MISDIEHAVSFASCFKLSFKFDPGNSLLIQLVFRITEFCQFL